MVASEAFRLGQTAVRGIDGQRAGRHPTDQQIWSALNDAMRDRSPEDALPPFLDHHIGPDRVQGKRAHSGTLTLGE
ncbi:hypothetical protein GCM10011575_48200 [Microlunatus endophyticus]|uniref:Uncharacterized protein n=1 Tax=Microlunatus endophyticus TaxID=1716077 RepID=A0A917SIZ2_9ACTN|nr:hypothetical protein GCM10011575_48200 [Microlunatus endophyticus]